MKPQKAIDALVDIALHNALMLAQAGVHVFPLALVNPVAEGDGVKAQKKYYPFRWSTEATTDPERIVELFDTYPGSVVGIATGPSKLVVADVDDPKAPKRHKLEVPKTHDYTTLRGGSHHLYRAPKKFPVKTQSGAPTILTADGTAITGIDTRATGGMLVYYGTKLDAPPVFAKAPKWMLVPAAESTTKAAPGLAMSAWLDSLRPGKMGPKLVEALEAVKTEGMQHGEMLLAQNELARLAAQGMPGAAKAVTKARERYLGNYPDHAKAWDDAMLDAAQTFGSPIIRPDAIARAAKGVEKRAGKKAKLTDEKPAKRDPLPRATPDDFFEQKTGLNGARLREYITYPGDIGRGIDGRFWRYEAGVWSPDDDAVRARAVEILDDRYRREHTGIAEDHVRHHPATPVITGKPHSAFINCRNGMLEWATGRLLPHDPSYRSTVQLAVDYTPGAPHPLFDSWLALVSADDPEMIVTLWEVVAYTAYNGNPFQVAAMLHGVANGGKSTFIELLENIAGSRNVAHLTPAQMEERFPPASLYGKLLNVQGEYEGKRLTSTNAFKSIVAGDVVSAEHKGKPGFDFRPWAFHVFAGNEFDLTSDTTEGYYRRWLTIDFRHRIRELIDFTLEDFMAEADAIFSASVPLLATLIPQKRFTETTHTMAADLRMRIETDTVATWLDDDEHVVVKDPSSVDAVTERPHVYTVYKTWSERNGYRPMTGQSFYKRLYRLGYAVKVIRGTRYLQGLKVDSSPALMAWTAEPAGRDGK